MLDGTFSVVGVLLPELVDYFGGGRGQAAIIGSVMGGCVMLSGNMTSRFGLVMIASKMTSCFQHGVMLS